MEHIVFSIGGMTCTNCQDRIKQRLRETNGIAAATVSFARNRADVTYDPQTISPERMEDLIKELGYSAVERKQNENTEVLKTAGTVLVIVLLYFLLQRSGILKLLVPSELADSNMSYGMLFVVGVLTSVHCVAMCGGINLSQSMPTDVATRSLLRPALYNAGRVISYTVIGFLLGLIGMLATGGTGTGIPTALQGALKIAAGTVMVIMGINMLGLIPWLRRFQIRVPLRRAGKINRIRQRARRPFAVGLLNGLMPCGPMQSMQIVALGSGNPIVGAASMLMFSLGTVPLMLGLGTMISAIGRQYTRTVMNLGAVLVVVLGLAMLAQGGSLMGLNAVLGSKTTAGVESALNVAMLSDTGKLQTVESILDFGAYPEITVYRGIPVKWTISASEEVINGCNYKMILSEYGITHEFTPGQNVIEFVPNQTGIVAYTCWMGMINGKINVIDK